MPRILLIAFLFYLIIWIVRGLIQPKPGGKKTIEQELVRDALTGVYFSRQEAISITTGGETLYFSNQANRDAWLLKNSRQS